MMTEDKKEKPSLFIGSSTESLDAAYAVQENLEYVAEVTVWTQGIFKLTDSSLDSLLKAVSNFDFCLFIFSPDDVLTLRNITSSAVRDNVVFELGLFISTLGKERTFILMPRNIKDFHLPTDLIGVTPGTYDAERKDGNLQAALGPSCNKVLKTIIALGPLRVTASSRSLRPLTTGLTEELRHEIAETFATHDHRIEGVFKNIEQRITALVENQVLMHYAEPIQYITNIVSRKLSSLSQALIIAIRHRHITADEYKCLIGSDDMGQALKLLRSVDLLVPLVGRDESNRRIPVYWFPPILSDYLSTLPSKIVKPSRSSKESVKIALEKCGYTGRLKIRLTRRSRGTRD